MSAVLRPPTSDPSRQESTHRAGPQESRAVHQRVPAQRLRRRGRHVEYLCRELARLMPVEVRCFGDQDVRARQPRACAATRPGEAAKRDTDPRFAGAARRLRPRACDGARTRSTPTSSTATPGTRDMAGFLAEQLWGVPLVLTIHSLEPLRPWKVEQLGNALPPEPPGWSGPRIEQADARRSPSRSETREDVLRLSTCQARRGSHVIHNGIDPEQYRRDPRPGRAGAARRRPGPAVRALRRPDHPAEGHHPPGQRDPGDRPGAAGRPLRRRARHARDRPGDGRRGSPRSAPSAPSVIWIREMLPRADVIQLYSHAAVFCCPSVYEPFGIINLEAMACETPVVASAVGGIPEVVVPEETGLLVEPQLVAGTFEPTDPAAFSAGSPPRSTGSPATPSSGRASAATAAAARSSSSAGTPLPRGPSISTGRCCRALSLQRHSGLVRSSQSSTGFCQVSRQQVSPVLG